MVLGTSHGMVLSLCMVLAAGYDPGCGMAWQSVGD